MQAEQTIDFHLKWNWFKFQKYYNQVASKHGYTMSEGYILLSIDSTNGTPSTQLGPLMGMEPRSLSRILNKMEIGGFITRITDKDDKRINRIFLTKLGAEKRAIAKSVVVSVNEHLQSNINKTDLDSFFKIMNTIKNIDFKTINLNE